MGVEAAIIGSSIIGGAASYMGGKSQASAQRRAAEIQAESFRFHKPYLQRNYTGAEGALGSAIEQGTYQGDTYSPMNPYETAGLNYIGNAGMQGGQAAMDMAASGANFGQNYADLYADGSKDRMGIANQYALDNADPIVKAAMRDDYRNLTENTLPGINQNASNSGNVNSSRAGMADAIANRGFDDRKADVSADVMRQLRGESTASQNQQFMDRMAATEGQANAFRTGVNAIGTAGDFMTGAGQGFRNYDQGALSDAENRSNQARDFELNQRIKYQQGILGQAETQSPQNPVMQTANPMAAGFGGAMAGAGMGMEFMKYYQPTPGVAPQGYASTQYMPIDQINSYGNYA